MKSVINVRRSMKTRRPSMRRVLRFLGLPHATRLEQVHPIYKRRMVVARRADDEDMAKLLSWAWAHLKRNMYRTCVVCGEATVRTQLCVIHQERRTQYTKLETIVVAVLLLTASTVHAAVTFDWPKFAGATNYSIHWGTNSIVVGNVTKATITNLPPDTDYLFALKAKTATGETELSDAIPYRTGSAPKPIPSPSNRVDRITLTITNGTWDVRTQRDIKP